MKKLHEIIESFCGDPEKDFALLVDTLNEEPQNEEEYFDKLEMAKLLKKFCEENVDIFKDYKELLVKIDIEFFEYYAKKFNNYISQKKYEMALFYVNKALWYYDLPQNFISFDSTFDFYVYSMTNPEFKGPFISSGESIIYLNYSTVCLGFEDVEKAIECIKHAIYCSPMNFVYYERAMYIFAKYNYVDELKECLENAYQVAKDDAEFGILQYYYAKYFYLTKKYVLSKVCINLAMQKNFNLNYKKDMMDIISNINKTNIITFDFMGDYSTILKENNVPLNRNPNLFLKSIVLYGKCLKKEIKDKALQVEAEKISKSFTSPKFIQMYKSSLLSGKEFYLINRTQIYFILDKKWQVMIDNKDKVNLFTAVFENNFIRANYFSKNIFKFVIDKTKNYDDVIEKKEFSTIQGKNVFYIIQKLEDNSYIFTAEFDICDEYIGTMNVTFNMNLDKAKKEFLNILSSCNKLIIK